MLDWSLDRQAMWFYHNQATIDHALYEQQLANNAALRAKVVELETKRIARDPHYIDSEYKDNPDLMYDDNYVHAVSNPTVVPHHGTSIGWIVLWIIFGVILLAIAIKLILFTDWENL
jgi:hypothetical protein